MPNFFPLKASSYQYSGASSPWTSVLSPRTRVRVLDVTCDNWDVTPGTSARAVAQPQDAVPLAGPVFTLP